MASIRTESISPFSIYTDQHDIINPTNRKSGTEHDKGLPEKCDIPLTSIENDDPFHPPSSSRRRFSSVTTTSISSFPSSDQSLVRDDDDIIIQNQFTPMRNRPAFRNTSSIKAMQMSSPPPMSPITSPRVPRFTEYTTPSRRSQTPQSQSGRSSRSNNQIDRQTPVTELSKQQFPLILLHITLLPLALPYPAHILELVLPDWILENFRLLESRLEDSILMGRGLLIPHPRHEYDLLEERILESLELATPRLLKSGHFHGKRGSISSSFGPCLEEESDDEGTERGGDSVSGGEFDDLCGDCMQPLGLPNRGAGSGLQRWEVKIYAANGLMRSGAWGAAWSEMERIDVEVRPWIPPEFRRALEMEVKKESQAPKPIMPQHMIAYGIPTPPISEPPHSRQQSSAEANLNSLAPIPSDLFGLNEPIYEHTEPLQEPAVESYTKPRRLSLPQVDDILPEKRRTGDVSLSTALLNYFYLLSQDRRNIAMVGLMFIVIFLSMRPQTSTHEISTSPGTGSVAPSSFTKESPVVQIQYVTLTATETVLDIMTETRSAGEILNTVYSEVQDEPNEATPYGSLETPARAKTAVLEPPREEPQSNSEPAPEKHMDLVLAGQPVLDDGLSLCLPRSPFVLDTQCMSGL